MTKPGFERRSEAPEVIELAASIEKYEPEQVEQVKEALDLDRDPTSAELASVIPDPASQS